MKEEILSLDAPTPIGPYSQAIMAGEFLFISGQIPIVPETGEVEEGGILEQTLRVMKNIDAILKKAGMEFDNIVKVTIFLTDLKNFSTVNEIYGKYFKKPYPARSTVEVKSLPKGVLIEIDAIAWKNKVK